MFFLFRLQEKKRAEDLREQLEKQKILFQESQQKLEEEYKGKRELEKMLEEAENRYVNLNRGECLNYCFRRCQQGEKRNFILHGARVVRRPEILNAPPPKNELSKYLETPKITKI